MHITNIISQYFGKFAKTEFPEFIQKFINNAYVKILKLDMSEFRNPRFYKSLNDLFTRELAIPREIDKSENIFISPADSFVTQCGKLKKELLLQIKGMEYSVEEMLTYNCANNFKRVKNGSYMNSTCIYNFNLRIIHHSLYSNISLIFWSNWVWINY